MSFAVPFTMIPSMIVRSPHFARPWPRPRAPPAKNQSLKSSKKYLRSRIVASTPDFALITAGRSGRAR